MLFDYESLPPGYYDFRPHTLRGIWHNKEFDLVEERSLSQKVDLIIEIGCGPGVFLRDYCKNVKNKVGFDISRKQIDYAKSLTNDIAFFSSFEDLVNEFEEKSWINCESVCIILIEVIEHIEDSLFLHMIETLKKVLSRKGVVDFRVVATTPNKKSMWPLVEIMIDFFLSTDYRQQHHNLMTLREMKDKVLKIPNSSIISLGSFMSVYDWLRKPSPLRLKNRFQSRGLLMLIEFSF